MTTQIQKIAVFGGNGFVGVHVLEKLVQEGARCICISRTGMMPAHLRESPPDWAEAVDWVKGDASKPDVDLLTDAEAVVTLVGSPPVPTLSETAWERQVFMNGDTNVGAIEGAALAGVKRVVLLGAHMPKMMHTPRFGYYVGKKRALDAARKFADLSPEHTATVIRPTAIYGTRHTGKGNPIPLGTFMAPVAKIQLSFPHFLRKMLPEPLVSVDQVASALAKAATTGQRSKERFTVIENEQILNAHR